MTIVPPRGRHHTPSRFSEATLYKLAWQGEDDPNVPPRMGRYLAESIPDCRATFIPGAGHLLIFSHWRDVMEQVMAVQAKLA